MKFIFQVTSWSTPWKADSHSDVKQIPAFMQLDGLLPWTSWTRWIQL